MSTTTPSEHLAALRSKLEWDITCAGSLAESRRKFAQQYAYDATVKYHAHPGEENRTKERRALNSAFWHDGARHEVESAAHILIGLRKLLDAYEESLKAVPAVPVPTPVETDRNYVEF